LARPLSARGRKNLTTRSTDFTELKEEGNESSKQYREDRKHLMDAINMQLDATLTMERSDLEELLAETQGLILQEEGVLSESAIDRELAALEEIAPTSPIGKANWKDIEDALEALDRELAQQK